MTTMGSEEIIDCIDMVAWERWLGEHYEQPGIWVRIAKKNAKERSVTIAEALDVALCYGWIDSQRKGYNEHYYLQRYSPRRAKSPWSKLNVERAEALMAAGRMQPAGLLEIEAAQKDGRWDVAYESQRNFTVPAELEEALCSNARLSIQEEKLGF